MLSIATFKWAKPGYRSVFTAENVNTTRRMIARHYPDPHEFICVTDDPIGLDPEVKVIPLWDDYASIPNPTWPTGPSCYRRLKVFSKWFQEQQEGDRLVVVDLDVVFTGDLRPLWNRDDEFLIWRPGYIRQPVCASMFMLRRGAHQRIWDDFDATMSPMLAGRAGFRGSDQAWIAYCVGRGVPGWTTEDGVYGYKDHIATTPRPKRQVALSALQMRQLKAKQALQPPKPVEPERVFGELPANARVVMFTGKPDPWDRTARIDSPWIASHYL